jgi:hypothetical protein
VDVVVLVFKPKAVLLHSLDQCGQLDFRVADGLPQQFRESPIEGRVEQLLPELLELKHPLLNFLGPHDASDPPSFEKSAYYLGRRLLEINFNGRLYFCDRLHDLHSTFNLMPTDKSLSKAPVVLNNVV